MAVLLVLDPRSGDAIAEIRRTAPERVEALVTRARRVQPAWEDVPLATRSALLAQAATMLVERTDAIAHALARESGRSRREARREVGAVVERAPDVLRRVERAVRPEVRGEERGFVRLEWAARGVVGVRAGWASPLAEPAEAVLAALALGNAVVLRACPFAPLSAASLGELLGMYLPEGVLQVVQGDEDLDGALERAGLDASVDAGRGRATPCVLLDDADVAEAAEFAARCVTGVDASAPTRLVPVLAHPRAAQLFERALAARLRAAGRPLVPLLAPAHARAVHVALTAALAEGARCVVGGDPPEGPGFVHPPTFVAGVEPDAPLLREDLAAPVVALATADLDDAELAAWAAACPGADGLHLWTREVRRAFAVARHVRGAEVVVNDAPLAERRGALAREPERWLARERRIHYPRVTRTKLTLPE